MLDSSTVSLRRCCICNRWNESGQFLIRAEYWLRFLVHPRSHFDLREYAHAKECVIALRNATDVDTVANLGTCISLGLAGKNLRYQRFQVNEIKSQEQIALILGRSTT